MKKRAVKIDFTVMAKAISLHVRKKAALSGATIVYIKRGQMIEENPVTHHTRILKREYSV